MAKPTPPTHKINAALRKKAVEAAKSGAPLRIVALALGFTLKEFNAWMEVGREEDDYEQQHNASKPDLSDERWEALLLYRELTKARAIVALNASKRVVSAMKKSVGAAMWWLEKNLDEYKKDGGKDSNQPPIHVTYVVPPNGR